MRKSIPVTTLALVALLGLGVTVCGQCPTPVAPGFENFDALIPPPVAPAQGILNLTALPTGWSHDVSVYANSWRLWTGAPGSYFGNDPDGQTGPLTDHTTAIGSGTGNYLFTESSSNAVGDTAVVEVCFDLSTLPTPGLSFWYHMHGTSMGTLNVEQSLDGGLTWPITVFTQSGPQGTAWHLADNMPLTPDANGQAHLRFVGISGGTWRSDMAFDDVTVENMSYATNDGDGHIDLDGDLGSSVRPLIVNKLTTPCGGPSTTLNVSSQNPGAYHEIAMSPAALVAPGIPLLGDTLNLSVLSMSFLYGGATPVLIPMPGGIPPFAGPGQWSSQFVVSSVVDLSTQAVFTAPSLPAGVALSAPFELHVSISATLPPLPVPPLGDDDSLMIDVTAPSTCFAANGLSFNGTTYTIIHVETNGRIAFGAPDHDFGASVTDALGSVPFFGFWTDFTPLTGISVSNPATGVLRVDYTSVPYYGETAACTFALEIDDANLEYIVDGLGGIVANPLTVVDSSDSQFLGVSAGFAGGATDGGVTTFTPGGSGAGTVASDMIYDFYDGPLAGPTGPGLLPSLVTVGLTKVTFLSLSPAPGFVWSGL